MNKIVNYLNNYNPIFKLRERCLALHIKIYFDILIAQVTQLERHTQAEEHLNYAREEVERHNALRLDALLANHRLRRVSTLADC